MPHVVGRRAGALAATGAVVALLGVAPSVGASSSGMLLTGGASGPTAQLAVDGAIEDAVSTGSAFGLYDCTVVGEPQVFSRPNDRNGRFFSAQADVFCE